MMKEMGWEVPEALLLLASWSLWYCFHKMSGGYLCCPAFELGLYCLLLLFTGIDANAYPALL